MKMGRRVSFRSAFFPLNLAWIFNGIFSNWMAKYERAQKSFHWVWNRPILLQAAPVISINHLFTRTSLLSFEDKPSANSRLCLHFAVKVFSSKLVSFPVTFRPIKGPFWAFWGALSSTSRHLICAMKERLHTINNWSCSTFYKLPNYTWPDILSATLQNIQQMYRNTMYLKLNQPYALKVSALW